MPHCPGTVVGGGCNAPKLYGGGCGATAHTIVGGNLHIRHSNRKMHKKKRKTLRKFLSKKRRGLLNTLKRTFKYKKGNKKRKSKSQKKRRPMKKRKSAKKRMRGGGALSPASYGSEATRVDPNIIDSARFSVGDNLNGQSALANPPPIVRTDGCRV
jgi:hypothetical protein